MQLQQKMEKNKKYICVCFKNLNYLYSKIKMLISLLCASHKFILFNQLFGN